MDLTKKVLPLSADEKGLWDKFIADFNGENVDFEKHQKSNEIPIIPDFPPFPLNRVDMRKNTGFKDWWNFKPYSRAWSYLFERTFPGAKFYIHRPYHFGTYGDGFSPLVEIPTMFGKPRIWLHLQSDLSAYFTYPDHNSAGQIKELKEFNGNWRESFDFLIGIFHEHYDGVIPYDVVANIPPKS